MVSRDVDLVVPVARLGEVKAALERVEGYSPAPDEPSVWTSEDPERLEVNFIGLDPVLRESSESYPVLSLMKPLPEMPDPSAAREHVVRLIERLEAVA